MKMPKNPKRMTYNQKLDFLRASTYAFQGAWLPIIEEVFERWMDEHRDEKREFLSYFRDVAATRRLLQPTKIAGSARKIVLTFPGTVLTAEVTSRSTVRVSTKTDTIAYAKNFGISF